MISFHSLRRALLALVFLALLGGCAGGTESGSAPSAPPPTAAPRPTTYPALPSGLQQVKVMRVVDGDTIDVQIDGKVEPVRMLGINTPETGLGQRELECFGREASAWTKALLSGQTVLIEFDASQGRRDQYDRLLAFVWLEDGRLINLELISQGYAFEYIPPTPTRYQEVLRAAQREARAAQRGLWAAQTCNGRRDADPAAASTAAAAPQPAAPQPAVTAPAAPAANCDPAYPDVCIAPPPPDLDCRDITYRNFRVLPPDPHNFDPDGDGRGCERS